MDKTRLIERIRSHAIAASRRREADYEAEKTYAVTVVIALLLMTLAAATGFAR
jgi:hypothetical protein